MATPRTGKPRGRPPKILAEDLDRYGVALLDALTTLGMKRRKAAKIAAAWMIGEIDVRGLKRGEASSPGSMPVVFRKRTAPGLPATFEGKASTYRVKAEQSLDERSADVRLRLATAWLCALTGKDARAWAIAGDALGKVGESRFFDEVLTPMFAVRFE